MRAAPSDVSQCQTRISVHLPLQQRLTHSQRGLVEERHSCERFAWCFGNYSRLDPAVFSPGLYISASEGVTVRVTLRKPAKLRGSLGGELVTIPRCVPLRTYGPGKHFTRGSHM